MLTCDKVGAVLREFAEKNRKGQIPRYSGKNDAERRMAYLLRHILTLDGGSVEDGIRDLLHGCLGALTRPDSKLGPEQVQRLLVVFAMAIEGNFGA
jgi:hypothetical protein